MSCYAFTQEQANEVGGILETDGLDIVLAKKLCENWTRRSNHSDIRYSYSIPFVGKNFMNSISASNPAPLFLPTTAKDISWKIFQGLQLGLR